MRINIVLNIIKHTLVGALLSIYCSSNLTIIPTSLSVCLIISISLTLILFILTSCIKKVSESKIYKISELILLNILFIFGIYLANNITLYLIFVILALEIILVLNLVIYTMPNFLSVVIVLCVYMAAILISLIFQFSISSINKFDLMTIISSINNKINNLITFNINIWLLVPIIVIPIVLSFLIYSINSNKEIVEKDKSGTERSKIEKKAIYQLAKFNRWARKEFKEENNSNIDIDYIFMKIKSYIPDGECLGIEFLWKKYLYSKKSLSEEEFEKLSMAIKHFLKEGVKKIG